MWIKGKLAQLQLSAARLLRNCEHALRVAGVLVLDEENAKDVVSAPAELHLIEPVAALTLCRVRIAHMQALSLQGGAHAPVAAADSAILLLRGTVQERAAQKTRKIK